MSGTSSSAPQVRIPAETQIVSGDGAIYATGKGYTSWKKDYQPEPNWKFRRVPSPEGETPAEIQTQPMRSILRTKEHNLYMYGYGFRNVKNDRERSGTLVFRASDRDTTIASFSLGPKLLLVADGNGKLWSLGNNLYGNSGMDASRPATKRLTESDFQPPSPLRVVKVSAALYHSAVVCNDGSVYVFGVNQYGQLGLEDAPQGEPSEPRKIPPSAITEGQGDENANISSVVCTRYNTLFLTEKGDVWYAGREFDGSTETSFTPRKIPFLKDIADIYGNGRTFCARTRSDDWWFWGRVAHNIDGSGKLFNPAPQVDPRLGGYKLEFLGETYSIFLDLKRSGVVVAGTSETGGLGLPEGETSVLDGHVPVKGLRFYDVQDVEKRSRFQGDFPSETLFINADRLLCGAGANYDGEVTKSGKRFREISTPYAHSISKVVATRSRSLLLTQKGVLVMNGFDMEWPRLRPVLRRELYIPAQIRDVALGGNQWDAVRSDTENYYHIIACSSTGELWARGDNRMGQLGIPGRRTIVGNFQRVPKVDKIASVACGLKHSLVLKTDGNVLSFGSNEFGQSARPFKRSSTAKPSSPYSLTGEEPKQVPVPGKVIQIACGNNRSFFLTERGELYTCGDQSPLLLTERVYDEREALGLTKPKAAKKTPSRVPSPMSVGAEVRDIDIGDDSEEDQSGASESESESEDELPSMPMDRNGDEAEPGNAFIMEKRDFKPSLTKVTNLGRQVIEVHCSGDSVCASNSIGEWFFWGHMPYAPVPRTAATFFKRPFKDENLNGAKFVYQSKNISLFAASDLVTLLVAGKSKTGGLGLGEIVQALKKHVKVPKFSYASVPEEPQALPLKDKSPIASPPKAVDNKERLLGKKRRPEPRPKSKPAPAPAPVVKVPFPVNRPRTEEDDRDDEEDDYILGLLRKQEAEKKAREAEKKAQEASEKAHEDDTRMFGYHYLKLTDQAEKEDGDGETDVHSSKGNSSSKTTTTGGAGEEELETPESPRSKIMRLRAMIGSSLDQSALYDELQYSTYPCAVCGNRALYECGDCHQVFYCSRACQVFDWGDLHHDSSCTHAYDNDD